MKFRSTFGSLATLLVTGACAFPHIDLGELPGGAAGTTPHDSGGQGGSHPAQAGAPNAGAPGGGSPDYAAMDVAVGYYHACALMTGGEVFCWGSNYGGQLGDGTTTDSERPVRVVNLPNTAQHIDADYTDSCAQLADGTLRCWGSNLYGQLGNGTTAWSEPTPIMSLGYAVQHVSLGEYHSCGLALDGSVQCWGEGTVGPLGDGTSNSSVTPVNVLGITSAVQVSAAADESCALLEDGTVSCWGGYPFCVYGDKQLIPVTIPGVNNVRQVSAGGAQTCALHTDGRVSCWGSTDNGNLGIPEETILPCDYRGPALLAGLDDIVQVASGNAHTCALRANGEIYCWGWNRFGQLGDGTTETHANPTRVLGVSSAVKISAGYGATCAILADHQISCWGELGDLAAVTEPHSVPYLMKF